MTERRNRQLKSRSALGPGIAERRRFDGFIASAERLGTAHTWMASLVSRRVSHRSLRLGLVKRNIAIASASIGKDTRLYAPAIGSRLAEPRMPAVGGYLEPHTILKRYLDIGGQASKGHNAYDLSRTKSGLTIGLPLSGSRVSSDSSEKAKPATSPAQKDLITPSPRTVTLEYLRQLPGRMLNSARNRAVESAPRRVLGSSIKPGVASRTDITNALTQKLGGSERPFHRLAPTWSGSTQADAINPGSVKREFSGSSYLSRIATLIQKALKFNGLKMPQGRESLIERRTDNSKMASARAGVREMGSMRVGARTNRLATVRPVASVIPRLHERSDEAAKPTLDGFYPPQSKGNAPKTRDADRSQPLVVNFSPTVVIRGVTQPDNIEQRVVQVIERHSHELLQIIHRELKSRQRVAF